MRKIINNLLSQLRVNSSRVYLDQFTRKAALSLPAGSIVLDAGAGKCLYKHHFIHHNYESADFCQIDKEYGEITYVCDLTSIPVDSNKYDLILLTQVLEHLPEPEKVLTELYRVLKPGGELWLSAPLFYEEHERPYDYYRYTQYGLSYLVEASGFTIKQLEWLEGYYGTLSYQLAVASRSLPWLPKHYGQGFLGILASVGIFIVRFNLAVLSMMFSKLDRRHKYMLSGQCKNYTVVAVK